MSRRLFAMVLVALVGPLLTVAWPAAASAQSDHDQIQGLWTVVSVGVSGVGIPADRAKCMLVKIEDRRILIKEANRHYAEVMEYVIDPSKGPKWIDLICPRVPNEPRILGIYQLDGDNLKLAWRKCPGAARPVDFVCRKRDYPTATNDMSVHLPLNVRPADLVCPLDEYWRREVEAARLRGEDPDKLRERLKCCDEDDLLIFTLKRAKKNP